MHIQIPFLTIIVNLIGISSAFNDDRPGYVNNNNAYFVSEVEAMPLKYKSNMKQAVLQIENSSKSNITYSTIKPSSVITKSATTTTSILQSSTSSILSSIQTETMTAGMTYLYSEYNDEAYYVNVTINSNDYPVLIDTGSPYLWIYSSDCTDDSCKGKKLFDATGAEKINGTFALSYDSGIASGSIFEEKIIIAGYKTDNFEFGVANEVPSLFESYDFSGVLGLPADNISSTGLVNAVSFLAENGEIDSSKFTICMGEYESDSFNSGLLFLGSTKDSLHIGDIYTSPIIQDSNHWEFQMDSIYVNDYQITFDSISINDITTDISRIGLLDSGTTSLVLPLDDATIIHSFFPNSITDGENYAILCNSTLIFDFEISGKNWSLTPEMYLGNEYSSSSDLNGYCISNIQGLNSTSSGTWILGILFMQNKYVEFDYENQWIGLAERNNNIKFVNPPNNNNVTSISSISTILSSSEYSSATTLSTSTTASSIISSSTTTHSNYAFNINPISNNYWSISIFSILCILNLY